MHEQLLAKIDAMMVLAHAPAAVALEEADALLSATAQLDPETPENPTLAQLRRRIGLIGDMLRVRRRVVDTTALVEPVLSVVHQESVVPLLWSGLLATRDAGADELARALKQHAVAAGDTAERVAADAAAQQQLEALVQEQQSEATRARARCSEAATDETPVLEARLAKYRTRSSILAELLVAFIVATDVDWIRDPQLLAAMAEATALAE